VSERTVVGPRLAVSRWSAADERGLILWCGTPHTEWVPLGTIGRASGHTVDVDTLTVTPSIVAGSWHGFLTNGKWVDA
jgi:hypothetical protein